MSTKPPSRLWITAFSARFHTRRSSRLLSPATSAGSVRSATDSRRSAAAPAAAARAPPAAVGEVHVLVALHRAASDRASASRPSISRLAADHLVADHVAQRAAGRRRSPDGSASATSISVRITVSGVRSSCEALATKRRWLVEGRLEAVEHVVEGLGQLAQLVVGPVGVDPPVERARRSRARAAVTISRSGPSTRPAASQPSRSASAVTASSASAYCPRTSASTSSATGAESVRWRWRVEQPVAHAQQQAARHQEQRRVERGEPQPDGRPREHQTL